MKQLTEKQKKAMQLMPNYKAFIESGTDEKVARLLSMTYLMVTVANGYAEEAVDLMKKYDLVLKKIKTAANNLMQSFDVFDKILFALIDNDEARRQFANDYNIFSEFCDKFMNSTIDDVLTKQDE